MRKAAVEVPGCFTYTMERLPVQSTADRGITIPACFVFKGALTRAVAYISGLRERLLLEISTRILAVRESASRIGLMKAIRPLKISPGMLCRVYSSESPTFKKDTSES